MTSGHQNKKDEIGKATGLINVSVELEVLEDYGIDKIATLHNDNEICDTGQILLDISKSIFIAMPKKKKQGAADCELHRTIGCVSHITIILLRILMM